MGQMVQCNLPTETLTDNELIITLIALVNFIRKLDHEGIIDGENKELYDRLMQECRYRILQVQLGDRRNDERGPSTRG